MKSGMTIHKKWQAGDRWIWLCKEEQTGQECLEWGIYTSISPDATQTEHGHYFSNGSNAIQDFDARIKQYFPVPIPVASENGWSARFEARRGVQSGGTDIYLMSTLVDGTTDYTIYNDQYDNIWEVNDRLTKMDADAFDVDLVLRGKLISVKFYQTCDWSWWAHFQGKHKKLNISWRIDVYEVIHLITEFNGDRLFR